jgi:tetratricopeptide (TPR) repeat protein
VSTPADDLFRQAVALQRAGDPAAAIPLYEALIAIAPDHYDAHVNLGVALRHTGRAAEAVERYRQAEALRPQDPTPPLSRGAALADLGRLDAALAAFDRAIAVQPQGASAHYRRGVVLQALQRLDEAVASYDTAIRLDPTLAEAQLNRANCLSHLGRSGEALTGYDALLALPTAIPYAVHYNRARVLEDLGRLGEAVEGFSQAIAAKPDLEDAWFDRGRCRLGLGDLAAGWLDYEHRWRAPTYLRTAAGDFVPRLRDRLDPDLSVADLAGREVLVVGEQGVGDILMFASILSDLAATARSVRLACEPRLHDLFRQSFPATRILGLDGLDAALAEAGAVLAIGSLARLYRNRREDFPGQPYLAPSPAAGARAAAALGPREGRLRVGLSWRGGIERTRRGARSIPLADLRPLLDLEGCEFVSLQYGDHAAEIAAVNAGLSRPIRTLPPDAISDFDDLAGVVRALDVVVSVQTALIHLTGALGAPCLVMVPHVPEWRYSPAFPEMPWYRSVTLLRQGPELDWTPVIDRVAARLRELSLPIKGGAAPRYSGS